ncbi:hypothetical protein SUDANB95_00880 [Actinosynnema sp. ALI-1.44]
MAGWLRGLDAPGLRDVLALRRDAADTRPRSLRALADELSTAASLRLAVDGLDRGCRDVLDAVLALGGAVAPVGVDVLAERLRCNGKAGRAELKRALAELRARALVWDSGEALRAAPNLRPCGTEPPRRITPAPRAPRRVAQNRAFADRAATASAASTVDGVTRLVGLCDGEVVSARGGVGVRELRRVAGLLRADEARARLWLELAVEARLLAVADWRVVPTTRSDPWRGAEPADRLAALASAWPRLVWQPGKSRPALADPLSCGDVTRRGVLERFARLGEDEAFEHRHEVVAELTWQRPAFQGAVVTEAALVEAEAVGLVALGTATALGRAVLAGRESEVANRFVPPAAHTALLRPDLTAVVAGLPDDELSSVLDLAADAAEGGWRFTGASVRRALDAGHSPERLLARLAAIAEHGVPQPVERLVREVARRQGRISVTAVASCVRADDPELLTEIAGHRSLTPLSLQPLGPTVLASAKPADETLALLRAAGYTPTADGALDRTPRRRVEPPPRKIPTWRRWRASLTDQELARLAVALLERERPRPRIVPPKVESRRLTTVRLLRDQSLVLRDSEVVLLAEALVTRTSVEIAVADGPRSTIRHVITPVEHAAGNLTANGPHGEQREFLVGHIRSVKPVEPHPIV